MNNYCRAERVTDGILRRSRAGRVYEQLYEQIKCKGQDCRADRSPCETAMEQNSSPKSPATGVISYSHLQTVVKRRGMLHSGIHGVLPTFWDLLLVTFKMSYYFSLNETFSQFNHLVCFSVCSADTNDCFYLYFTQHPSFFGTGFVLYVLLYLFKKLTKNNESFFLASLAFNKHNFQLSFKKNWHCILQSTDFSVDTKPTEFL